MAMNNITKLLKAHPTTVILSAVFVFALIFAYMMVTGNLNLIAALSAGMGLVLVLYFRLAGIFILFFIVFTGDQFTDLGIIPHIFPDVLISILMVVLFFKALFLKIYHQEKIKLTGIFPILALIFVCMSSALFNNTQPLRMGLFIRHLIQFYLFFLAVLNLDLEEKELKTVNWFVAALFLIQIPTAILKWFGFGYSRMIDSFGGEAAVGTYGTQPGAMSTLLPLIAIGFLFPLFMWTRKKVYMALIFGFILFSFLGGKRAFPLILPIFGLYLLFLMRTHFRFQPSIRSVLIGGGILILALFLGAKLHPSLNPDDKVWGRFSPKYLVDMAFNYTTAQRAEGQTIGRLSSTQRLVTSMSRDGVYTLLLGKGPGTYLKSGLIEESFYRRFRHTFGIEYGFTGFVWVFAQTGILGALCLVWLLFVFFKEAFFLYKEDFPSYWKLFSLGVMGAVFVVGFDFLAYSTQFTAGKVLPVVFYYTLAALIMAGSLGEERKDSEKESSVNETEEAGES